jgi:CobQ-like glutamine amidotransferase family enzyme
MYELNVCYLYPDLLNLYGDRGNIMALAFRMKGMGINANIRYVSLGDEFRPEDHDIVFIGGGQNYEQEILQTDLIRNKAQGIYKAIDNDVVFLCICGGFQLLGRYYLTFDGTEIELLGILDFYTTGSEKRLIGDIVIQCDFLKSENSRGTVVGFENHSGLTFLGSSLKPLGKVLKGHGNNGNDGYEGAIYKNVYCSYLHGSLLPKNPELTDHLLSLAFQRKYGTDLPKNMFDDKMEKLAHEKMVSRLLG